MQVLSDLELKAVKSTLTTLFLEQYEQSALDEKILSIPAEINMDLSRGTINFPLDTTGFGQWSGEHSFQKLVEKGISFKLAKFNEGIEMDYDDLKDQQTSGYEQMAKQLGEDAVFHHINQIIEILENGEDTKGYDDKKFFSSSHASSQSNLITQSGVTNGTPELADLHDLILDAKVAMSSFYNNSKKPYHFGQGKLVLITEPKLGSMALRLSMASELSSGVTNLLKDSIDVIISPLLTAKDDETRFYLLDSSKLRKPILKVSRKGEPSVNIESWLDKEKDVYRWAASIRSTYLPGHWAAAVKGKITA